MSAAPAGRRKKHHEEEHENHERWLVTYADFITVLMALFIVMFALSNADAKKFEEFANGMNDKPGAGETFLAGGDGLLLAPTDPMAMEVEAAKAALDEKQAQQAAASQEIEDLIKAREAINQALHEKGMDGAVQFRLDERGLVVTVVTDDVLFDLGKASLRAAGTKVLDAIAPAINTLPNSISVEGHTDDLPIRGRFASNWELSTERATSVLRYMLDTHHLPANRVSASGYADQRPLTPNTPAGRATNRRVEVVVLKLAVPVVAAPPTKPAIAPIPPLGITSTGGTTTAAAPAPAPATESH